VSLNEFFQSLLSGSVAGGVVAALVIRFWGSYVQEKGKNLATKQDIADITREIEEAKQPFFELQEQIKGFHQLRFAAIDRRLQAHQEAFTLWRKLLATAHTKDAGRTAMECQTWWERHCLYLEPTVRQAFVAAYNAAGEHRLYLEDRSNPDVVRENWRTITQFPAILFAAVQLPTLTPEEEKNLTEAARHAAGEHIATPR